MNKKLLNAAEENSLEERPVISVTGAGGKTTYIRNTAREFLNQGKKVLITTTTHMALPEMGCDRTLSDIRRHIDGQGWSLAGHPVLHKGIEKMAGLEDAVLNEAIMLADVVLIEADGSRRLPFKVPKPWEPVIHPATTKIVIMAGLAATRKPVMECCYNWEEICRGIHKKPGDYLTREDMRLAVERTYLKKFADMGTRVPVELCFTGEENDWKYDIESLSVLELV